MLHIQNHPQSKNLLTALWVVWNTSWSSQPQWGFAEQLRGTRRLKKALNLQNNQALIFFRNSLNLINLTAQIQKKHWEKHEKGCLRCRTCSDKNQEEFLLNSHFNTAWDCRPSKPCRWWQRTTPAVWLFQHRKPIKEAWLSHCTLRFTWFYLHIKFSTNSIVVEGSYISSSALRTWPRFAPSPLEKHHCMLKHILASTTHRKIQEFYSVERSTESHYFDIYWQEVKNGSDSTFCKAERTSKTFRDKGIQNRIQAGEQIRRTEMLYKT